MKETHSHIAEKILSGVRGVVTTGVTVNYMDEGLPQQKYVHTTYYQRLYGIHAKTLQRYLKTVEQLEPATQKLYFIYSNDAYWYTQKMLEFRKYNKDRSNLLPTRSIRHLKSGKGTDRQVFINLMVSHDWHYKCTANYQGSVSFDDCSLKMEKVFDDVARRYADADVTMFYSTEKNTDRKGYHNHFVISIAGAGRHKMETIKRKMRSVGSKIHECEKYDPKKGREFITYITKELGRNPACVGFLSNVPTMQ